MALGRCPRGLAVAAWFALASGCQSGPTTNLLSAEGPPLDDDLPRYGLNLGGSGTWGAEQLRANVLANPGLEAILDRTIVVASEASADRVVDDRDWLARPDGFWTGHGYDIRSGAGAGLSGRVLDSRKNPRGLAEIRLDRTDSRVRPGDVLVLTRDRDDTPAPLWWTAKGKIASAPGETRPGSPGSQSVRLLAGERQPAELIHYLDNIGERAGKLLPVRGEWRLAFWARARNPAARLHVRFDRGGHAVFVDAELVPESQWQQHVFRFAASDDGPPGVLTLALSALGGEVQIDDVWLGEAGTDSAGFRREVVDTLRGLRPGFLRDWQGQLGDTLRNRLAPEHGHRPARYRPGDDQAQFHYGLPDFLSLCAEVGAQPWVVAPTTLGDDEWRSLGAYLRDAADRHRFRQVMVEFGNENWNLLFRPGAITDPLRHAEVADRAFRLLREGSAGNRRIVSVANAQFVDPGSPRLLGRQSREAGRVAVAPYFLYRLDSGTTAAEAWRQAFAESDELIRQEAEEARRAGKRLAVYEENFHTTLGSADTATRNAVVTGAASGPALARRLLQGTLAGVREQAVYSFAGFDSYLDDGKGLVRLWGITRDLATPDRLRPTGLALAMLNRVSGGATHAVRCAGPDCSGLTAVAYRGGQRLAVVSSRDRTVPVSLPCAKDPLQLQVLDGSASAAGNAIDVEVRPLTSTIACRENRATFDLPAYSLAVVHP